MITGRGARGAGAELVRLLDATGALYLDTQESRGLVPADHPSVVGAVRAAAMTEADLVLVIGRKLDYQLGYGSPAVFPNARFVRIADTAGELIDNRRGEPELLATPAWRSRRSSRPPATASRTSITGWAEGLRRRHASAPRGRGDTPRPNGPTARSIPAASSMRSPRSPPPTTSRSPTAATC